MFPKSQTPRVSRSRGPKDQNMSKSQSNMSLTLKKVHLVEVYFYPLPPSWDIVPPYGVFFFFLKASLIYLFQIRVIKL